jgi:carbonic anhydrase
LVLVTASAGGPHIEADIRAAGTPSDWSDARGLIEAYAASLDVDLSFQGFADEIADLPAIYGPPSGCLLLARVAGRPQGCVAVRCFEEDVAELKRLYVDPAARGSGLGRDLVDRAIASARAMGYEALRLDTLPSMHAARALYRSRGFAPIGAYRHNPVPGVECFELSLRDEAAPSKERRE